MEQLISLCQAALAPATYFGYVSGAVGIFLGLASLFLAHRYYVETKNSETDLKGALADIRATSRTLAKITDKHLDRLTGIIDKAVTRDHGTERIAAKLQELTEAKEGLLSDQPTTTQSLDQSNAIEGHGLPGLPDPLTVEALRDNYLTILFALYYYTTHTNFVAGTYFPTSEEYDPTNKVHELLKSAVDNSVHDFAIVAQALSDIEKVHPDWLTSHRAYQMGEAGKAVKEFVKNSDQYFEWAKQVRNQA